MARHDTELATALGRGDPEAVAALIAAGADVHYRRRHGYDALLDAVHGRDVARDERLLDLLRLLIAYGVDLNGVSAYQETGLRVLSSLGRFDAVALLLEAGADPQPLGWTPLIEAVACGARAEVERLLDGGAALEERDWWERTAWLVALLAGDLDTARLLRDRGADTEARGRCGCPPLHYAIEGHHPDVVRWLIAIGQDVEQMDGFGATPLWRAVDESAAACVEVLLEAGANVEHRSPAGSLLGQAETKEIVRRLLDAGADPQNLSSAGQRILCGLADGGNELAGVSTEAFHRGRVRRFGTANPERVREPFWEAMIRTGVSAHEGAQFFATPGKTTRRQVFVAALPPHAASPVWSAQRFGQSITFLADGRVVQIAGEHEDSYDADFCIYSDVFVHDGRGGVEIFAYPEAVFPPTDFHTATLVEGAIYVIGSLGYVEERRYGHTPVYRLELDTWRVERLDVGGEAPGWIHGHRAEPVGTGAIRIRGGSVLVSDGTREQYQENSTTFMFDLTRRTWRRDR